jgi:ribosome recycling factor
MDEHTTSFKSISQTFVVKLQEELKGIRTGRANPGMVESIQVAAYGGTNMKLRDIATIMTEGSTTLVVVPFDPSTSKDIEKAILASPLGINPQVEGVKMYLRVPPLSEEQRTKYTKLISQMVEDTKNMIRRERDNMRKKIKAQLDAKTISEDDKFRTEKDIDTLTTSFMDELQDVKDRKEKEIMAV